MKVYKHLSQILTLDSARAKDGRHLTFEDLSIIDDGAIVFDNTTIHWVGKSSELPSRYLSFPMITLAGHVLTPGLIDSHTHLVFGGDRSREYVARLNGVDYQTIAQQGGGILHTMQETLALSEDEMVQSSIEKIDTMMNLGVRVIEIKSGYALTSEGELRILRAIKRLKEIYQGKIRLIATYLGAHAIPKDFQSSSIFLRKVVIPTLEQAKSDDLVDIVDIFAERGYFSNSDVEELFDVCKKLGLATKMHADEFNDNQGGSLAAQHGCLSADHLLMVSSDSIRRLANSNTVATLLPGTAFFLGKPLAPARQLLDQGCRVALATDYNPGSSHISNLLLVASLSCPSLKMNMGEMWAAITLNAAFALGLSNYGYLAPGAASSLSLFRASHVSEITYNWGRNLAVPLP